MPMTLGNDRRFVNPICQRSLLKVRRISAQSHRSADGIDTEQIAKFVDDRIWRAGIELGAVRILHPANITRIFDDRALHAETDPEIRNLLFSRILNSANHSR